MPALVSTGPHLSATSNVVFQVDRAREFVQRREIGSLTSTYFAFMGAQRPPYDRLLQDTASGGSTASAIRRRRRRLPDRDLTAVHAHRGCARARFRRARSGDDLHQSGPRTHRESKPPRALFVPFPFGHPLGEANEPELQTRVMHAALTLLEREAGPVLEDHPEDICAGQDSNLAQASSPSQADIPPTWPSR